MRKQTKERGGWRERAAWKPVLLGAEESLTRERDTHGIVVETMNSRSKRLASESAPAPY